MAASCFPFDEEIPRGQRPFLTNDEDKDERHDGCGG